MFENTIKVTALGLGLSVAAMVSATMSAERVIIPTDPKANASIEVVQALIRQEVDKLEKDLPDRVAEGIEKYFKNKQSQTQSQTQTQTQTEIRKTVVHVHRHYYPRYWWCPPPWFVEY